MARVMMWLNYRRAFNVSVPSPFDGDTTIPWWYDKVSMMAESLAAIGVTDILLPQPCKTNAGPYKGADGYGVYDQYDIGSKNTSQFGGTPTRFGAAEQLRRCIAICHANGMNVLIDHVMHQCMGGKGSVYRYSSATGKDNGRFPKDPQCFRKTEWNPKGVEVDQVPSPPDDFAFGDEFCPINAIPKNYVKDGLIDAGDWLFRTLDVDGARLDDMKGINIGFMKEWMTSKAMKGKWFFGEYASGNRNDTDWWVGQVDALSSAADFDFHYNMAQDMCQKAGSDTWQMAWLKGRGMIGSWPMKAVPWVESMDSDTNGFATIVDNKTLAYALMMCGEGLPAIYVRDYLPEPDCYGLKRHIDNLIWINRQLANGKTVSRYGDAKVYIFERTGDPGLICCLNNDIWNSSWKFVNVQTNFGPGVQLHDYTGHNANDCWTDWQGRVTLAIPPGANGMGYCCWSRAGFNERVAVSTRSTTQVFYGAKDLDIGPVTNSPIIVGRIWVAKNSNVLSTVTADRTGWVETSGIEWQIVNDAGPIGGGTISGTGTPTTSHSTANAEGWYNLTVTGNQLPAGGSEFNFSVTYTAPKSFKFIPPSSSMHAQLYKPDPVLEKEISEMSEKAANARAKRLEKSRAF